MRRHDYMLRSMIAANFTSWVHSSRVIASFCCVLVYCFLLSTQALTASINDITFALTIEEKIYLQMCQGFNKMGSLLFLLMISEIPLRSSFHYYTSIRTRRWKWLLSQLIYIALVSIFVLFVITLLYTAMIAASSSSSNAFTDDLMISQGYYSENYGIIAAEVRQHFSPQTAILWASLPVILFWCIMGFSVLLLSLLGHPLAGPSFFGFILMGLTNVNWEAAPEWFHLPIEYANITAIRTHPTLNSIQGINQVNCWLAAVLLLLAGIMVIIVRNMDYTKITKAW